MEVLILLIPVAGYFIRKYYLYLKLRKAVNRLSEYNMPLNMWIDKFSSMESVSVNMLTVNNVIKEVKDDYLGILVNMNKEDKRPLYVDSGFLVISAKLMLMCLHENITIQLDQEAA